MQLRLKIGLIRVKILKYDNNDETFLKCEVQVEDDQNISKDLIKDHHYAR